MVSNLEELLKIINPMSSTIFWSVIVFGILVIVLWKFVFKPVNNIISKRQSEIRDNISNAERQREEAKKYLKKQEEELEEAKKEAKRIIKASEEAAEKIKEEIEKKANEKSSIMISNALTEIRSEKERSINEVKDRIVKIALDTTEKMVSKIVLEKELKKLIEESSKEVREIQIGRKSNR